MTKQVFTILIGRIMRSDLAGELAAWLFVFPAPIATWLGFAYLEDLGILPEPIAVFFVCGLPLWVLVANAYIFIQMRKHFKGH